MRASPFRGWFAAVLMLLLTCTALAAQGGGVSGTVMDAGTGAPVAGARVQAVDGAGAVRATSTTNAGGAFTLDVPPGSYTVVVSGTGFEPRRFPAQVGAGRATTLTARISTGSVRLDPVVISASRRAEKALNAPAAVSVVDERTVEERPAISMAEHLRAVPGVDIATTGLQSSNVVARGFNNIFSGSLHMLTDNRIAGVPSLRVNLIHFIPTTNDDISRMEVVLGPGAALYGPNTADGILHVITKSPLEGSERTFSVAGGEQSLFHATGRVSQLFGENFGVKVSGQYLRGDEWRYTDRGEANERAKFDADATGFFRRDLMRAVGVDSASAVARISRIGQRDFDVRRWSGEARADWRIPSGPTTVFSVGSSTELSGVELTGLGASQVKDWTSRYYQVRSSWNRLFAQAYVNTSDAGDTYLLRNGAPIVDQSRLAVGQLQHGFSLGAGRQNFTYGADYIYTLPRTSGTINGFYEDHDQTREFGAYLQSETALSPRLDLVLAGRVDTHSALPEPIFSPRAALVFKPTSNHSFRATFNRAFSTPSSLNQFLDLGTSLPNNQLAGLGYSLRVQGTGEEGFTFRDAAGNYQVRSPFTPGALGGPGQLLPGNAATLFPLAVGVLAAGAQAAGAPLPPSLVAYLSGLHPTAAQVGLNYLNVVSGQTGALSTLAMPDLKPIRESTSNTFEGGYKGLFGNHLLIAADGWWTRRQKFVTPLTIQTPLVLLNGPQLGAYLVPRFMADLGYSQAQAQALAAQLIGSSSAPGLATIPVGVISSPGIDANGAQLLVTYQNVDESLDFWGSDLSATALTGPWSLSLAGSYVNRNRFDTESAGLVTLNAPRWKGSLTGGYRNDTNGLSGSARLRYTDGFPVNSGVYIGTRCLDPTSTNPLIEDCVKAYTLLDLNAGYRIPGARGVSLQVDVQNALNEKYRSFPGVPNVRRMAILRLKWEGM
jgi:outer membrane receptor for ferrienterochelin and colicins